MFYKGITHSWICIWLSIQWASYEIPQFRIKPKSSDGLLHSSFSKRVSVPSLHIGKRFSTKHLLSLIWCYDKLKNQVTQTYHCMAQYPVQYSCRVPAVEAVIAGYHTSCQSWTIIFLVEILAYVSDPQLCASDIIISVVDRCSDTCSWGPGTWIYWTEYWPWVTKSLVWNWWSFVQNENKAISPQNWQEAGCRYTEHK